MRARLRNVWGLNLIVYRLFCSMKNPYGFERFVEEMMNRRI